MNEAKPTLSQYLNIESAYAPSFSPDGQGVAFLSDSSGVPQVCRVALEGGPPEQLTSFSERCTFVCYSPAADQLVFGMDAGGDERQQLWLLSGDSQSLRPLTEEPNAIHLFGGWSADGERIAWSANRRDARHFDIYVQDVKSGRTECVWTTEGMNSIAGWSPNGEHLLVARSHSGFDQDLFLVEVGSGAVRLLTPHQSSVRYQSVCWAVDGSGLFLVSDRWREFLAAAHLDLRSPPEADGHATMSWLWESDWDVEALRLSPGGRYLACLTNREGYAELQVREILSDRVWDVLCLPSGVADAPHFHRWSPRLAIAPGGARLAVSVTGPRDNPDVWVIDVKAKTCRQLTHSSLADLRREDFVEPQLVHYPSFDGLQIPGFLYLPRETSSEPVPILMEIHGGPEAQRRPTFNALYQYVVSRGYGVFAPNVRGSTGYGLTYTHLDDVEKRMDSVADLAAGARWLAQEGIADRQRIAIMGGSYGGFMVLAALTTYPDLWAAGVDIVGIANFVTFLENTGPWRRHLREAEYGSLERDRELLQEISPIGHVDRIEAPLLVIHGANDPRVPVTEAEQIVRALRERDVPVGYLRYDDEGHGLSKLRNRLDAYQKVAEFLGQHVGL